MYPRIKAIRIAKNKTLKEFAAELDCHPQVLWMIEAGRIKVTEKLCERFESEYGIPRQKLLEPVELIIQERV